LILNCEKNIKSEEQLRKTSVENFKIEILKSFENYNEKLIIFEKKITLKQKKSF